MLEVLCPEAADSKLLHEKAFQDSNENDLNLFKAEKKLALSSFVKVD